MTSTVEWHRYGDKQPEGERNLLVGRSAYTMIAWYKTTEAIGPAWVDDHGAVYPVHPDDLWCYLPTPPEGGEA